MRKTNNHIGYVGYIQHRFCKSDEWSFWIWNGDTIGFDYNNNNMYKKFTV